MTMAAPLPLRFQVGARTLFSVRRRLVRVGLSLDEALAGGVPPLSPLEPGDDGYLITSLPEDQADALPASHPDKIAFARQRYSRRYADLSVGFDDYMMTFSGKSRSTLRRKVKKFGKFSGGELDLRSYRTPSEIAEFHILAREVSAKTYQEKLMDAGLPDGPEAETEMAGLAAADNVRAWLLFAEGKPVSYLYAPADGDTLIYAYLGYDPGFAKFSPGAVLQIEAMRQVIEEGRFRRFDFTEGDGQHKRQFATGSVECVDLLLLRKSVGNRAVLASLRAFDGSMALAKKAVRALNLEGLAKSVRR